MLLLHLDPDLCIRIYILHCIKMNAFVSASGSLLISDPVDIDCLRKDFLNDPAFSAKILEIEKIYAKLR